MVTIKTSDCDSFEDVRRLLQRVFNNQELIGAKLQQHLDEKPKKKPKAPAKIPTGKDPEPAKEPPNPKEKGTATMKTIVSIALMAVLVVASVAYAALGPITYNKVSNPSSLRRLMVDMHGRNANERNFFNGLKIDNITDGTMEWNEASEELIWTFTTNAINLSSGTGVVSMDFATIVTKHDQILLDPVATPVGTTEGTLYYDSDTDLLYVRNASGWVDLTAQAAASTPGGSDTQVQYNNSSALGGMTGLIWSGGVIEVQDAVPFAWGTGTDYASYYDNTNVLWYITTADTASGATENAMYTLSVDNGNSGCTADQAVFEIGKGSTTDASANWTELFEVDEDGDVSIAGTTTTGAGGYIMSGGAIMSNGTDTEVKFTEGGEDFSIDFVSNEIDFKSGSGVVAVGWGDLDAHTGLNSITMDAAASTITLAADGAADDFTISVTGAQNSSLVLSSAGTAEDALQITTTAGGINLTNGGAAGGEDIDLVSSNASVVANGGEAAADAIRLYASHADGGIDVDFGTANCTITGTGASADFTLDADLISIDGTGTSNITFTNGAGEDVTISTAGAADHSLIIQATGTTGDALQVITTAGGIDITNGGAAGGEDFDIANTTASMNISAAEDVEDAIVINASAGGVNITADGAAASDLDLVCTNGSANLSGGEAIATAVVISAGAGGVDITAAATFDIDLTATGGTIQCIASEAAANQFKVDAQGTIDGDAIVLETTEGGIQLLADGDTEGDIDIDCEDDMTITAAGDCTFAITGSLSLGDVLYTVTTTDDIDGETLTATQSGGVFTNQADSDNQVYTLPTAADGLIFTFLDVEGGAGADLYIRAAAGDTINGGTANQYYGCKTDAVGQSVTVIAIDATEWIVVSEVGTWVNDDAPD